VTKMFCLSRPEQRKALIALQRSLLDLQHESSMFAIDAEAQRMKNKQIQKKLTRTVRDSEQEYITPTHF